MPPLPQRRSGGRPSSDSAAATEPPPPYSAAKHGPTPPPRPPYSATKHAPDATSAADAHLRQHPLRGLASPTAPPVQIRTATPSSGSTILPRSSSSWLDTDLEMEQGVSLENSFPPDTNNRIVKIHSKSLENIMHVLEVEYHIICDELGEKEKKSNIEMASSLDIKLDYMLNTLKEARKRRSERWDQFVDVIQELEGYSPSLSPVQFRPSAVLLSHKPNLSLKRLREMKCLLKLFQKDKNTPRHLKDIYLSCDVLKLDFAEEIFKSDKEDDGSTVFRLEDVVKRLDGLKKEREKDIANDSNLGLKLMEAITKKKKVLAKLVSQCHLNGQDYEIDFTMEDVRTGEVDPLLIIQKLQGLIVKLKGRLKLREDILDGADKIFNCHNEEIQTVGFSAEMGALLEKVETWESCHRKEFMYGEIPLKMELLKIMPEVLPSSSSLRQTFEDNEDTPMSPSISSSSSASVSSSDCKSKDSDYSPESSQSDDNMQDFVVVESDSEDA